MSWDAYITSLMDDETMDAAIVGCESGKESVWASSKCGTLSCITPDEIRKISCNDHSPMFSSGATLGGVKCTLLRDKLHVEDDNTMDLRSKASDQDQDTYNICISKSNKALVIVKGKKNVHGGKMNVKAFDMAKHLKKSGY
ncbi:profilin-2-like [Conger conger]|nr:profilin-2-like [Conger conger]